MPRARPSRGNGGSCMLLVMDDLSGRQHRYLYHRLLPKQAVLLGPHDGSKPVKFLTQIEEARMTKRFEETGAMFIVVGPGDVEKLLDGDAEPLRT